MGNSLSNGEFMAYFERQTKGWRVQIRRKGVPAISKSFATKKEAEVWAAITEGSIGSGGYEHPSTELVESLFIRYRNEVSPRKKGRVYETTRINLMLRTATFMDLTLSEIGPLDIGAWRDARLTQVSAATVRREMNILSSVFNHARTEWGAALKTSPTDRVRRPPNPPPRTRRVSDAEVAALWAHMGSSTWTTKGYIPYLFELAVETGLRLGELCDLLWENVHDKWIVVVMSKNGEGREVPLSPRARDLFAQLPRSDARVFPVRQASVDALFRAAKKALGWEGLHFHDTRHEACTRLSKVFAVHDLARLLGHRDLKSLLIYYNPAIGDLAAKFDQPQSKR
jgi:integrase